MGRFINADKYPSTGQGLLGNNIFSYCCNNPVVRRDIHGTAYKNTTDDYRPVGAGVQLELDMGNISVGFEIIVYWDVEEGSLENPIVAVYDYSGGSTNFGDEYLGSIIATVKNNTNLLTSGTEKGITAVIDILKKNYSVSVSGLLIMGNDEFRSITSYEGPFVSLYGSANHVKGALAVSSNCVAFGVGGTSSLAPSWGLSVTNYSLIGTIAFTAA